LHVARTTDAGSWLDIGARLADQADEAPAGQMARRLDVRRELLLAGHLFNPVQLVDGVYIGASAYIVKGLDSRLDI
jgi:hypothetical protein